VHAVLAIDTVAVLCCARSFWWLLLSAARPAWRAAGTFGLGILPPAFPAHPSTAAIGAVFRGEMRIPERVAFGAGAAGASGGFH